MNGGKKNREERTLSTSSLNDLRFPSHIDSINRVELSQPSSRRNDGKDVRKNCVCVHKIIVVLGYRHHLAQTRRALTHKNTFYFTIHQQAKTSGEKKIVNGTKTKKSKR